MEIDSGGLLATFRVPELKTMRSFVCSWGPNVVALAPPDLVDDARQTAAAYDGAGEGGGPSRSGHKTST